jgi:hypothetical protein
MAIEIAGGTEMLIYAALMILGATLAVIFPYILNKWNDPATTVNWKYVAVLLLGVIVAVLFGLPAKVDVIDTDAIKAAVLAGYGLQAIVSKLVKSYLESKTDDPGT